MKLREHLRSKWNKYDMATLLLFIPIVISRVSPLNNYFVNASAIYAIAWIMCSLRILQSFYLNRNVGPKIEMIGRMWRNLLSFLFLFVVFLVAYGVAHRTLVYPNVSNTDKSLWDELYHMVHNPYYVIFQQFDDIQDQFKDCTHNQTLHLTSPEEHPMCSWWAVIYVRSLRRRDQSVVS